MFLGRSHTLISQIVALSLKFRILLTAAAAVVLAVGAAQLRAAPVDVLPEFTPPQVQIQTEALGLSAAEVEQLITIPIEHDLLNGVPWLAQIRSESAPGLSSIVLIFKPGTDPLKARQVVQERMTQAHALPNVGSSPVIVPPVSSASRVMMIGLSSKELSLVELSVLARWKIKPRLMGVPGVANVTIWGQRDRQLQVQVDPVRLRQNGVTLSQVITTTGNALWSSPLTFVEASTPGTGGFIDTSNQRFSIQHVSPITTAEALSSVTIEETGGRRLRLDQVANVVEDHQPLIGDAVLSRGPGLMLVVEKFPGADTRAITDGVQEALDALRPGLSGVQIDPDVYQAQSFIDAALRNLGIWAVAGPLLVLLLLFLALFSVRLVAISFVTIVLSLVAAMYVLFLAGIGFNLMVLGGLAVALGLVINDALVDLRSLQRRLWDRRTDDHGSAVTGLSDEAGDLRSPQLYGTLIVLLAVLPLAFLSGVAGALAWPAVAAYVLAVLSSTLVALTVAPALAFMLLRNQPLWRRTSPLARGAQWLFEKAFPRYVLRPRLAYGTLAVLLLAGATGALQLGGGPLVPAQQDRTLVIHWQSAPGTSLPEMVRITSSAMKELSAVPGVEHVSAHLGRAITSDQVANVNSGEIWVTLGDEADYDRTVASIQRVLRGYSGMRSSLVTYPQDRVRAVEAGTSDPVAVRIYGANLDVLRQKADEVRQRISTVPGIVRPKVQNLDEEPTLEVRVNLQKAQQYGINPGDVRRTAATYFSGLNVGNLYQEQKVFDVVVKGTPSLQTGPNSLNDMLIDTQTGDEVRLGDIAEVRVVPYPTVIRHDATLRSLDVTAEVQGRDLGAVLKDVRDRVQKVQMPLEYHTEIVSGAAEQADHNLQTAGLALAVLIGMFLLLQAALVSWRLATLALATLPLSVAGGVLVAFFVGGIMTLGVLLGLVAVLGITVRNTVVLIGTYQRVQAGREAPADLDSVMSATRERAGAILLTAGATVAALIPLVVLGPTAGTELLRPLATVVIGGLVSSTLLTVFVMPALYLRFATAFHTGQADLEVQPAPAGQPVGPAPATRQP
jgi:CzcA family heavy metal efflux pump